MTEKLEAVFGDWRDFIDVDFPEVKITEETREATVAYALSHPTDNVRIAMGRFYTDKEYQDHRQKILSTLLP